jgi:hypothetical protein
MLLTLDLNVVLSQASIIFINALILSSGSSNVEAFSFFHQQNSHNDNG